MSNKLKRRISAMLSFVMLVSVMLSSVSVTAYAAGGAKVDVWDFGCVAESDTSIYDNHITVDVINNIKLLGTDGKFLAGDVDFGGLIINTVANDRMYCAASSKNYGTNSKAQAAYSDGYIANGMWYANGTGGDSRRYAKIDTINAGDQVVVYTGPSNAAALSVHFTYLGEDGVQDDILPVADGEMEKLSFVAKYSGSYKIWYDTSVTGKPVINRIVRYPATAVTASIPNLAEATTSGCTVELKNLTTDDSFTVDIPAGENTFTLNVTPGYKYSATLKGAIGYGFTYASKFVEVPVTAVTTGVSASFTVEPKETYDLTGNIKGFGADYDLSKLTLTLTPDTTDTDTIKAELDGTAFKATLEPDVTYTATLGGVNDYEITSGASFLYSNVTKAQQDIEVAPKAVYAVTGSFVTSDGATLAIGDVTALVFTNLEDGYTYSAEIGATADTYLAALRDGEYQAAVSSDKYKTSTHVSVKGGKVERNLYLKEKTVTPPQVDTSVKDIYVGCEGKVNNFETVGEAFAAAAVINPQSEADRVTIHIAPGVYREQTSLSTPYVSLVKEGTGEVVLTWYYGIGYKYYSAAATGYWDDEADFDKYDKKGPEKWGTSTYIKSGAKFFKAEDITFETSFNKYMTDEEIIDGVESDGSMAFVRSLGKTVTSKAATERATAISIEADNVEFKNCKFIGSQDTLYMGAPVRVYYKDCIIEGNTDYIFGSGNAVFDGCELRFCGYSDSGNGGYITAARNDADKWVSAPVAFKGYLFRSCTITNKAVDGEGNTMLHAPGYFGRPWDQAATVTYLNTKLENADAINTAGWTSMSGATPENANYKEYNTTYLGQAVDVTGRTAGTVMTAEEAAAVKALDYFGDWTPTYYTEGTAAVDFTIVPYFSSDVDVLLPASGDTLTVKYSLGANDSVDASRIDWYRVAEDSTETLIKTTSAATEGGNAYKLTAADEGSFIKAVVTPATVEGAEGTAQSTTTVKTVDKGSGSGGVVTPRPSGKVAIFLAGDSTVKDYSEGAINNATTRSEGSWGEFLEEFVNSNYIVRDYAEGGRSSRTFIDGTKADGSDRFLDKIKSEMVAGDYLFIQFGHNDSSASYADRYVPVGEPDENGVFPATAPTADGAGDGTFKWYLQEMVNAAKEVGATPVMVTPVSRMYFNSDGTIYSHHGSNDEYVTVTKQVAEENGIECIDLYAYTKDLYEKAYADGGLDLPTALFAKGEKTHHSKIGGFAIAAQMAYELKTNTVLGLENAIVTPVSTSSVNGSGETEFRIWSDGRFEGYAVNAEGAYDTSIVDTYWTDYINGQLAAIKAYTPVKPDGIWGDVDNSGELTAADAAAILQYTLNNTFDTEGKFDFTLADVTADNSITANDASFVLQKVLDSTFEFPAAA